MMTWIITLLPFLAFCVCAEECANELPTVYCEIYKDFICFDKSKAVFCNNTCGICPGSTVSPTAVPGTEGPMLPCGIPAVQQSRVIGGQNAKPGAWPWQVALYYWGGYFCGGSLVTPRWIITAAHCIGYRHSQYKALLGVHNVTTIQPDQFIDIEKIIVHPKFGNYNNDIALLKLARPAILNDRVRTVCLPKAGEDVPVGTKCYITGFGKIKHPGGPQTILQQADMLVVSQATCTALNTNNTGITITPEMVCGGYGPSNIKSGCHGDSGGPFVCQNGKGGAFTLQGAVSWGSSYCDTRDAYSVFARISAFRSWIDKSISE